MENDNNKRPRRRIPVGGGSGNSSSPRPAFRPGGGTSTGGGNRFNNNNRRPGGGGGGGYKKNFQRKPKFEYDPNDRDMYYIALACPQDMDEKFTLWKEQMNILYGCQVAGKSPAHLTIIPPFYASKPKFKDLLGKLKKFQSPVHTLEIELDGFGHFDNKVIFADVKENADLSLFQETIENYLRNSGFPFIRQMKKPLHAHITIATRDLKEEDFDKAWSHFDGKSYSESFTTGKLYLYRLQDEKWTPVREYNLDGTPVELLIDSTNSEQEA